MMMLKPQAVVKYLGQASINQSINEIQGNLVFKLIHSVSLYVPIRFLIQIARKSLVPSPSPQSVSLSVLVEVS